MKADTAILLIAIISFATCIGVIHKASVQSHDIVYGSVKVRGEVYSCKKWEATKEKRK
jgi:hypothetical protein